MCTHNHSWIVATHCDVLRPGCCCQAKDEDEHGDDEQQHRHYYGFPLSPFKGTYKTVNITVSITRDQTTTDQTTALHSVQPLHIFLSSSLGPSAHSI